MKRNLRYLALFAVLALVLAACGDGGAGDTTTTAGGDTTTSAAADTTTSASGGTTTTGGATSTTAGEVPDGTGRTVGMAFDVGGRGDLSFNDFLVHLAPLIVVLMVVFCLLCRWLFRAAFTVDPEKTAGVMKLNEREAIKDRRMLVSALGVLTLVVLAFVLHPVLHYEPSVVAVLGAGLLVLITGLDTSEAIADVEWPTLLPVTATEGR